MELANFIIGIISLCLAAYAIRSSRKIAKEQREFEIRMESQRIKREQQTAANRLKAKEIAESSSLASLAGCQKDLEEKTFLNLQLGKK